MSDFKSNEYKKLIGGSRYEPDEENPMLGFRGAARYIADSFRECFRLEAAALKKVRNDMGLTNVEIMIPFVRTLTEAKAVTELLAANGLKRGDGAAPDGSGGLRLIMMCEVPSNAVLADAFLDYFDGFSIGSNDLTQLTLGLDRDSGLVAGRLRRARSGGEGAAVAWRSRPAAGAASTSASAARARRTTPDFAEWLMEQGIESISLNPDTVVETWQRLARPA